LYNKTSRLLEQGRKYDEYADKRYYEMATLLILSRLYIQYYAQETFTMARIGQKKVVVRIGSGLQLFVILFI
jgi:hypothetical protein